MQPSSDTFLQLAVVHSVGFGLFHLGFWRLFSWRTELAKVSRVNRGVMQVLNLCLTYVFFAMGYIVYAHRQELPDTPLGRSLLAGIALFWILRLIQQAVFFDLRHPASQVLVGLCAAGAVFHGWPLLAAG